MKVALSLSGGGFRATLFHLGVISYLRRVGALEHVAAVCGVSGGAIIGAHLVQNWERYTGTDKEFDAVALEVIRLTQRDVRGRILRRLPWAVFLKPFKALRTSRCSMFERELSRFFGDAELLCSAAASNGHPRPELFILATDLATGQSCSFDARGFCRDGTSTMETTVLRTATAVATSASFPGFFPPLVVTADSLGIKRETWGNQPECSLTDGGVFDNLGVRKLQSLREKLDVSVEILSDAGASLEPRPDRFSGLVRTALRAVDILSNRVLDLEYERVNPEDAAAREEIAATIRRSAVVSNRLPLLIPVRIKDEARVADSPGASIQATLQRIRTDLDAFSDTEVRWLVRHGGSVARQALETRGTALTIVNLDRGKQPPWDPMRALYPRRKWSEPDSKDNVRAWKDLESAGQRRLGLLSLRDWVSWVNLAALVLVIVVAYFSVTSVTTRAGFLSQAYDENYNVTFHYTPDSAKQWAQEYHPKLIDYVTGKTDTPAPGYSPDVVAQATDYRNYAGKTGQGRAFVRVFPPQNFKMDEGVSDRRTAISKMRSSPDSLWKGILYYTFPSSTAAAASPLLPGLDWLLPNWKEAPTVLQFEGHPIGNGHELCLAFVQDGKRFSRFSTRFELDERLGQPPIVPRKGSVILPRSQQPSTDISVTRSEEACGVSADNGFVLGTMRLE
jgi:predicted acylesterase/phospholipase RssA